MRAVHQQHVDLDVEPEAAFDFVALRFLHTAASWQLDVREVRPLQPTAAAMAEGLRGVLAVGKKRGEHGRTFVVEQLLAPALFVLSGEDSSSYGDTYREVFSFLPLGGGTRVVWVRVQQTDNPLVVLAGKLGRSRAEERMKKSLARLQRQLRP